MASGRRAAVAVCKDLLGIEEAPESKIFVSRGAWHELRRDDLVFLRTDVSERDREKLDFISLDERKTTFKEVTSTMPRERVMAEGGRCIECSCTDKKNCKLRQHADEYNCDPEAFTGGKQVVSYDTRHPLIIQDRGKCIKCGTCVKICKEVVGKSLLALKKRGFSTCVETAFNAGFPESCSDCGACVEACPTGALDWRHKV